MTQSFKLTLIWIAGALAAVVVALAPMSSAMVDGHYIPVGPDGFYHARRILDAVADPASFFQFDAFTQVPEGNLVSWPWAYDYLLIILVRLALALHVTGNALAALVHIPVVAFAAATLLVLWICRSLQFTPWATLLAIFATVFFPLNQAIYSIGNIDHHYAEHLFVLGTLGAALAWLRAPTSRRHAVVAGLVFGLATGVHSASFALQLPLLGTLLLLWLRREPLPRHVPAFAVALVAAQLAVALPSLPLRMGMFQYTHLSWFQPYVALCTAIAALLLARLPRNLRGASIFTVVCVVLLVPTVHQVLSASSFFAKSIGDMDDIVEVRSVLEVWSAAGSFGFVASNYTWLLALLPLSAALSAWWLWRPRDAVQAHFALASLAGLVLLLSQARLQYFGSFALYLPLLAALSAWRPAQPRLVLAANAAAALVAIAAYLPGARSRVFAPHLLAEEPTYAVTHDIYPVLGAACAAQPGLVIADPYDGHYVRYHSRCTVLANNFLVTKQDVDKVIEERRLLSLAPAELAAAAPLARYVFVHRSKMFFPQPDGRVAFAPDAAPLADEPRLVRELLAADEGALPSNMRLLYELQTGPGKPAFARLFAVAAPQATP